MGFKFKKFLRKIETTAKKVAPAALTVVNPAMGATFAAVQKGIQQAKMRASSQGEVAADLSTISSVGSTGLSSPIGITQFQSPQPSVGDTERFDRWQSGDYRKPFSDMIKSPAVLVLAAVSLILLFVIFLNRRR